MYNRLIYEIVERQRPWEARLLETIFDRLIQVDVDIKKRKRDIISDEREIKLSILFESALDYLSK